MDPKVSSWFLLDLYCLQFFMVLFSSLELIKAPQGSLYFFIRDFLSTVLAPLLAAAGGKSGIFCFFY